MDLAEIHIVFYFRKVWDAQSALTKINSYKCSHSINKSFLDEVAIGDAIHDLLSIKTRVVWLVRDAFGASVEEIVGNL